MARALGSTLAAGGGARRGSLAAFDDVLPGLAQRAGTPLLVEVIVEPDPDFDP